MTPTWHRLVPPKHLHFPPLQNCGHSSRGAPQAHMALCNTPPQTDTRRRARCPRRLLQRHSNRTTSAVARHRPRRTPTSLWRGAAARRGAAAHQRHLSARGASAPSGREAPRAHGRPAPPPAVHRGGQSRDGRAAWFAH